MSTDHGLEQDFNSLDAQHDAAQAYNRSQAHAGWTLIRARYDDGGYSGGSTDRPALQRLLSDVKAGKIDVIVVYKVDRLTRSLADFAKLVELFDGRGVSSSRSPSSSIRRPRWAGSRSTFCCRLRSSNGRSSGNARATRFAPPAAGASGPAGCRCSATMWTRAAAVS